VFLLTVVDCRSLKRGGSFFVYCIVVHMATNYRRSMRQVATLILTIFLTINLYGQDKIRPILWFGPANNVAVYGVSISPIVFKLPTNSVVNGINIEGFGIPLFLYMIPHDPADRIDSITIGKDFNVNGLNLALAGILQRGTVNGVAATILYSFINQVNGAEISLFFNIAYKLNGLSISLNNSTVELNGLQIGFFNKAKKTRGLQLGVINRTNHLKGLQIGFWNINEKRKLPIINW
jgi:hypothetical protein